MAQIETSELKAVLMPLADEARARIQTHALPAVTEAHYSAMQRCLYTLLNFLNKIEQGEANTMAKLTDELSTQIVKISEIEPIRKASELEDKILGQLKSIRTGEAALIDPKQIKFGHLSSKLSTMKKAKRLPADVRLIKRGEKYYLARV